MHKKNNCFAPLRRSVVRGPLQSVSFCPLTRTKGQRPCGVVWVWWLILLDSSAPWLTGFHYPTWSGLDRSWSHKVVLELIACATGGFFCAPCDASAVEVVEDMQVLSRCLVITLPQNLFNRSIKPSCDTLESLTLSLLWGMPRAMATLLPTLLNKSEKVLWVCCFV